MFKSELELEIKFIEQLNQKKKDNENIIQQFNARFGNVDVVKVILDNDLYVSSSQATTLSTYANSMVVAFLHKKQTRTLNYLIRKTGYTKEYILNIISNLKRDNIIIELSEHKYIISDKFKFPKLKFNAYELKLKDWRKAILQAVKNTNFAYASYVVMPNDEACKIYKKYSDVFYKYNIGLIGVNELDFKTYIKSKKELQNCFINPVFISSVAKYSLLVENQAI